MAFPMENPYLRAIKKELFRNAMQGKWGEVVKIYGVEPTAHKAKITRSGNTALHIAVADGQEDFVEQLVKQLSKPEEVLSIKNEHGNTPLHLAASMGSVRMCECIASKDSTLVGSRNNDGETPLFTAALHGKKDAFLCLHQQVSGPSNINGYQYSRRKDGDTILHCAIVGEYFDLAFQIIQLYGILVNSVNEQGLSPLHLLASKPSAFRSGSHLSQFNKIIYHCIFVEDLKRASLPQRSTKTSEDTKRTSEDRTKAMYPENYQTCIMSFQHLWNVIKLIGRLFKNSNNQASINFSRLRNVIKLPECCRKYAQEPSRQVDAENPNERKGDLPLKGCQSNDGAKEHGLLFPPNYHICLEFIKLIYKAILIVLGLGSRDIKKIQMKKEKHIWSVQIMNELLQRASSYEYDDNGRNPQPQPSTSKQDGETTPYNVMPQMKMEETNQEGGTGEKKDEKHKDAEEEKKIQMDKGETTMLITAKTDIKQKIVEQVLELFPGAIQDMNSDKMYTVLLAEKKKKIQEMEKKETPILIAAKNGIKEMVKGILELFPVAIHDMNSDKKNIVHLAVENRQPHVYDFLVKRNILKDTIFRKLDNEDNSVLHLAAMLRDYRPWHIPGEALQMQWEIKWYEYVRDSMPLHFFARYNKHGKTPKDIFTESHNDLVKKGGEWLNSTSNSCSVVAALIATVAFATSATVPGGINQDTGKPTLEHQPAFNVFAISSLVALCFSVTSVVMFLAILTSRHQERDFGKGLPRRLLLGLTSLFVSIGAILISFCAGHFFVLKDELKYAAFPVYAVTCLPVTFFAAAQFPLYFDLLWATFSKLPQRAYKSIH